MLFEKGYVQVYTGDGKGKTTAAFGLAFRCAGAGGKVFIGQFLKGRDSSERIPAESAGIEVKNFGGIGFITGEPSESDIKAANEAFNVCSEKVLSGIYDLVVIDEINVAVDLGLINLADVLALIREKPEQIELVLTGRNAKDELIEAADLCTEMKKIKHYYDADVPARFGVED